MARLFAPQLERHLEELYDPEHFRFRSCRPGRVAAAEERAELQYRQRLEQAIRQLGAMLLRVTTMGSSDDLRRGQIGEPEQLRRLGFDRGAFGERAQAAGGFASGVRTSLCFSIGCH